jgi:thiol:disulfide interchange protein
MASLFALRSVAVWRMMQEGLRGETMAQTKKRGGAQKSSGAPAAILVVFVLLLAAVFWNWRANRSRQEPATVESTAPAPVITPDTVMPTSGRHIYPSVWSAQGDIDTALAEAKKSGKRVIVDFGGDWCPDCQVLDIYFHQSPNSELLAKGFVKVNVNIGQMDQNIDLAAKYGVPIARGVPALAVLDTDGKVLYSQKTGEFNSMARMQSSSVTEFLTRWKPQPA